MGVESGYDIYGGGGAGTMAEYAVMQKQYKIWQQ